LLHKTLHEVWRNEMKKLLSAAVALWLSVGIANAVDPPEQKEGLWTIHRQSIDNPGNKKSESTATICRNHAYDQHAQSLAKNVQGCTTLSETLRAGKLSVAMHCVEAGTAVDSKGTVIFQGDTAAHSESHATYTPAMGGVNDTTMIMDQKYVGSCPAGAQPGDLTTADGKTVHLWKH
jgi:hypothetical protein